MQNSFLQEKCGGSLYALCGVSLGGQIVMELLSRKPDLTEKAIIDGSICYPNPAMARFSIITLRLCGKMMFSRISCQLQLKLLAKTALRYPKEICAYYMEDMPHLRMETLYTMYRTYMMEYQLKESVRNSKAQVMYWYGEKEMKCVKKSAKLFKSYVPSCQIYEAKGCNHGYLAVYLPQRWLETALPFLEK